MLCGMTQRKIIHVDMDAFYASVEQRDNPQLRGQPVIVGGSPSSRGVVCTASYEARTFGVRSAMACSQAARLCPHGIFIPPNFAKYRAVSQAIHQIFADYVTSRDQIEPLSLDEAYLDVSDNRAQLPSATAIAKEIRQRVKDDLKLTISAGVSCNKLIAKLASDEYKPDGLCVVPPTRIAEFLKGRPLRQFPGIGPKTAERLERSRLLVVDDVLSAEAKVLEQALGNQAERYLRFAQGIDHRPVRRPKAAKQVSLERTFQEDITDPRRLHDTLHEFCESCWRRLCRVGTDVPLPSELPEGRCGKTVTIKVKFADFSLHTRSHSEPSGVQRLRQLQGIAHLLLEPLIADHMAIRLLGVGVSNWIGEHKDDDKTPGDAQQMTLKFE